MSPQRRQLLKSKIISYLKVNISNDRLNHILRVAKTVKKYAKDLGLDHNKAEISGLLHDIGKEIKGKKLLQLAKKNKINLYEIDKKSPHVLHARVGAIIAKKKFKIKDPDILGGIRCHTLSEPNMRKIPMLVMLADATEPKREKKTAEPIIKTFKEKGLEEAVLHTINNKIFDAIKKNRTIHPLTLKAREWIIERLF